jgi:AmmeMemoRadiSam system protein B/AmmeMemoRadiSam system protein A
MMRFAIFTLLLACALAASASVRSPAVAGAFYPGDAKTLRAEIEGLLAEQPHEGPRAAAIIVPHAGYAFSAPTAAKAFARLDGDAIDRIILLGPSHSEAFAGGALPGEGVTAFATPLGDIPLDRDALQTLRACDDFAGPARAHDREHSLEVELPFIQVVAPAAPIVPVVVGHRTDRQMARRMARCLSGLMGPGTVVVASTDFSHHGRAFGFAPFAGDEDIGRRLLDLARLTAGRAAAIDPRGFAQQVEVSGDTVCGVRPVTVLLELLDHAFDGEGSILAATTSGHVTGDWSRVVSYVAVALDGSWRPWHDHGPAGELGTLDGPQREAIVELARATLRSHLEHDGSLAEWFAHHPHPVTALAGAFVTVNNRGARAQRHGKLRACMGVIEARQPLVDAVIHAAVSAAHDPRFPALQADELPLVDLEVSVLSPTRRVSGPEAIVVGTHGVVLSRDGRSAVFLPQVAPEQGWDRDTMLDHLARKAGLPRDAWRKGATFEVFTAQVIEEHE